MNDGRRHLSGRLLAWLILSGLLLIGLYSLAVWSFSMFEGGWQMGLACLILLVAPGGLWWLMFSKRKS